MSSALTLTSMGKCTACSPCHRVTCKDKEESGGVQSVRKHERVMKKKTDWKDVFYSDHFLLLCERERERETDTVTCLFKNEIQDKEA